MSYTVETESEGIIFKQPKGKLPPDEIVVNVSELLPDDQYRVKRKVSEIVEKKVVEKKGEPSESREKVEKKVETNRERIAAIYDMYIKLNDIVTPYETIKYFDYHRLIVTNKYGEQLIFNIDVFIYMCEYVKYSLELYKYYPRKSLYDSIIFWDKMVKYYKYISSRTVLQDQINLLYNDYVNNRDLLF